VAAGSYPHDCDPRASFDEALVADLLPDLRREWPSYMSLGDSFWAHEWLKHGTCSRPVFNDEHGARELGYRLFFPKIPLSQARHLLAACVGRRERRASLL
jgi:ribonuclease I